MAFLFRASKIGDKLNGSLVSRYCMNLNAAFFDAVLSFSRASCDLSVRSGRYNAVWHVPPTHTLFLSLLSQMFEYYHAAVDERVAVPLDSPHSPTKPSCVDRSRSGAGLLVLFFDHVAFENLKLTRVHLLCQEAVVSSEVIVVN